MLEVGRAGNILSSRRGKGGGGFSAAAAAAEARLVWGGCAPEVVDCPRCV